MARVFVSYRRADGPYGVGWLAERLHSLDAVTGVETAFHDASLRAGDDFPDALHEEIDRCDLVVVVIGPNWLGITPNGPARIQDPDDWVVREIATAMAQEKRLIPVLIGEADHPLASEIHPSIAGLARLHALPFAEESDLDTIVQDIESHLGEIDRARAMRSGLEEPVEVPRLHKPGRLVAITTVAAALGGIGGWVAAGLSLCPGANGSCALTETTAWSWFLPTLVLMGAYMFAVGLVGTVLAVRVVSVTKHRWRPLIGVFALGGLVIGLLIATTQSGHLLLMSSDSVNAPEWRGWTAFIAANLGMMPLAIILISPAFSEMRAPRHELGERVRQLGIARDAERWGAVLLAVALAFATVLGATLAAAARQAREIDQVEAVALIGFSIILTIVLISAHSLAMVRLRDAQGSLERDLAELPPKYRENATPQLMARTFDDGGWGFRALLALPTIMSIVAVGIVGAA